MRLLRGQIVVRENLGSDYAEYTHLVIPELGTADERARARKSHVGTVLQMGAPALTSKGVEVTPDFKVGDVVVFHFNHHEKSWTRPWIDGENAVWVPQQSVDGVVEPTLCSLEQMMAS